MVVHPRNQKIKCLKFKKEILKIGRLKKQMLPKVVFQDNGYSIWVWLEPYKYTNESNVKKIAEFLARAYKMQTGYNQLVIVTVWDYNNRIYVKGNA